MSQPNAANFATKTVALNPNTGLPMGDASSPMYTEPLGIPGEPRSQAATTASADVTLTSTVTRISIKARTSDLRYKVGVGAQTASATTSHYIESGERLDIAVPLGAHIAVIRDSGATVDGVLCITELG